MENEKIVECINLEKKYFLFDKDYKIIPWLFTKKGCSEERTPLTNINFSINKGDVIGFLGKNGAGKSTLMKIIAGITMHTGGNLKVNGTVNSLINLGAGFNPKYTGRQNIYYKGLLMGMSEAVIDEIIDEIIDFCEIGDYFDLPMYMYSSGMAARLGFALAIFADHDILIVDEVFAVGDKMFREKSSKKMEELFKSGKSIIFASHSDDQIRQFCNRAIFIDESTIVVDGTVEDALDAYNKKYDPNKYKIAEAEKIEVETKKNEAEAEKIEIETKLKRVAENKVCLEVDEFLSKIYYGNILDRADFYREIALINEKIGNMDLAYKYMQNAKYIRPSGIFIVEKVSEYEKLLKVNDTENNKINENDFCKIDSVLNFFKLNRTSIEKADLCREIAVFYEQEGNIELAFQYMAYAKEFRPTGPYIIQKYEEYKKI